MTDPYAEIDALRRRLRAIEAAAGINPAPVTFTTGQISNPDFWRENRDAILAASREPGTPRIIESEPEAPVRVEYPPTDIPRLVQRGPGIYESTPQKEAKP